MSDLFSESWFPWAVAVAVGLPVVLIALSEVVERLAQRGSPFAAPMRLLRSVIVPAGALIVVLVQVAGYEGDTTAVRLVATFFGFALILLALSVLTAALFGSAERGSWRARLPDIFIDLGRLLLIAVGTAMLFSLVWDANVGGIVAALGVTSIVIGLAVQNAVGSIISGLLLLFEQPFTIGDWLRHGATVGRVVEVNWRAVHIDTGHNLEIVPNAALASSSFANLSRPNVEHTETIAVVVSGKHPPNEVAGVLTAVARDVPQVEDPASVSTSVSGYDGANVTYQTSFEVPLHDVAGAARSQFLTRLWYAAHRHGLQVAGLPGDEETADVAARLHAVAGALQLTSDDIARLAAVADVARYGNDELLLREGVVPERMIYILSGSVVAELDVPGTGRVPYRHLGPDDYFGHRLLTREPPRSNMRAVGDVVALRIPQSALVTLVEHKPQLLREMEEVRARYRSEERALLEPREPGAATSEPARPNGRQPATIA